MFSCCAISLEDTWPLNFFLNELSTLFHLFSLGNTVFCAIKRSQTPVFDYYSNRNLKWKMLAGYIVYYIHTHKIKTKIFVLLFFTNTANVIKEKPEQHKQNLATANTLS